MVKGLKIQERKGARAFTGAGSPKLRKNENGLWLMLNKLYSMHNICLAFATFTSASSSLSRSGRSADFNDLQASLVDRLELTAEEHGGDI